MEPEPEVVCSFEIGGFRVTSVAEAETPARAEWLLPGLTPELTGAYDFLAPFVAADGLLRMRVQALVIDTGSRRILVDTCVGNDKPRNIPFWDRLSTPFLERLSAAGHPPESIDTVLCTHLHVDHVGWNTRWEDDRWVPTFPEARYLFVEPEYRHWAAEGPRPEGDVHGDSVEPVLTAGRAELTAPDAVIADGVWLEPTFGHTPGHVSVHLRSEGAEAVITGDLMHHPAQCTHPEVGSTADTDPVAAERTRRAFIDRYADTDVAIIGTHFAGGRPGRIVTDGSFRRFQRDEP